MELKKGTWTPEEDQMLLASIEEHGIGKWSSIPEKAGLQRSGKSCRLRWINYLRPDVKRGKFSLQEEQTIIQLHALLGNRWSAIAAHLPKRTDNEIKNFWNTHIKKKFTKMGIDPTTHQPKSNILSAAVAGVGIRDTGTLRHKAQWERARLEAEARLANKSKSLWPKPNPKQYMPAQASTPARPQCLDVLKAWQNIVASMFYISTTACNNVNDNNHEPPLLLDNSNVPKSSVNEIHVAEGLWNGVIADDELMLLDEDRSNPTPKLNEIFDNSVSVMYPCRWTTSAAQNTVGEFSDILAHCFDYQIE